MELSWIRLKRNLTWMVILSLLATGLIVSCGRSGGGDGSQSNSGTSTSGNLSGTGTVVITGRIL